MPQSLTSTEEYVFYVENDSGLPTKLWRTDGTVGGEQMLQELSSGSTINKFSVLDNILYYSVDDSSANTGESIGLWKSDGTPEGTEKVFTVEDGSANTVQFVREFDGQIYLGTDRGLWKSDGTTAGTIQISTAMVFRELSSSLSDTSTAGDLLTGLYFVATDADTSTKSLWRSDGTNVGTAKVKGGFNSIGEMAILNQELIFVARDVSGESQVWKSGGSLISKICGSFIFLFGLTGGLTSQY